MKNYEEFARLRGAFKNYCAELAAASPELKKAQTELIRERGGGQYTLVNPVVYNTALDEIDGESEIKIILIGDNPGRREQEECRYLIGASGKLAENFFNKESALGIDFRKNVLILNKTPVHTPRTAGLRTLSKTGGFTVATLIEESQRRMAAFLGDFYRAVQAPIWITGYSEMKKNGIFGAWTEALCSMAKSGEINPQDIFIYRHFSMNQFTIDLKRQRREGETTEAALKRLGAEYRERILSKLGTWDLGLGTRF